MNKMFLPKIIFSLFFISFNCAIAQVGMWSQKENFGGLSRSSAISFSIGTKGYIGTGRVDNNVDAIDFWEFDPQNNTWTQKADIGNTGRSFGLGFSIGDKGYVGLGLSAGLPKSDFWEYDQQNNIWTQKAFYPGTGKVSAVGFSINDLGYIGTGSPTNQIGNETKQFWEYNPSNNSWTQKTDFGGLRRDRAVGFSLASKGYIGTGYHFDGTSPITYGDFWEYEPDTDSWTQKASVQELARHFGVGFSTESKGYIGMGYLNKTDFWQYDPNMDSWLQVSSFNGEGRLSPSAFSIGNNGYVGMGYSVGTNGTIFYNDIWEYVEESLSVSENELKNKLKVYPNPTTSIINITPNIDITELIIYNLNGKVLLKTSNSSIDLRNFASGAYYLNILTANGLITKKIIKL